MKFASWNVNSLNVRLPHVLDWLASQHAADHATDHRRQAANNGIDVLGLQELKMTDDKFPKQAIEEAGYHVAFTGQKTYNGVALISRYPIEDVVTDIDGVDNAERRIIAATINGVRVINLYVVNGQEVGTEKYHYKLQWLEAVTQWIEAQQAEHKKVLVMGDFNIAPDDRDVWSPKNWHEKILCSTPEREALDKLLSLGFTDSFRCFDQQQSTWSWWDYRSKGYETGRGLRIDLILTTALLTERCISSVIDDTPRGWERPSDHAPAVAHFRNVNLNNA